MKYCWIIVWLKRFDQPDFLETVTAFLLPFKHFIEIIVKILLQLYKLLLLCPGILSLQTLRPLLDRWHLRVWGQLPGAFHQVQLLQHHPHHHEQPWSHCHLDLHLWAQEHLLQCGVQGERRDASGAGQGETLEWRDRHFLQELIETRNEAKRVWTVTNRIPLDAYFAL